jgi:restriction endonuclease S subunit
LNRPFNEKKYEGLLEGLEATEIMLSDFLENNIDFRLDAEYFSKDNLALDKQLDKCGFKNIGEIAFVTDGIHTSIDYSEESNVKLVSATSPRENCFDFSRNVFISETTHLQNPRTALNVGDVVISTVGTIGNCAVVQPSDLPANSDRHVGIIRINNKRFLPNYVSTFLLSKYGRFQTFRESTGNVQLNLFIYKIKSLKIADLSINFQQKIENIVKSAHLKRELSQSLYRQAENLLLESIGLKDFTPTSKTTNMNIKSFKESFLATGRLDAEYYQPKYDEIITKLKKRPHALLGDLVTIKKSIEPGSDVYSDEGLPFIRVSDYSKFGISTPEKCLSTRFCNENAAMLQTLHPVKETILFSKDGSVGIAFMLRKDMRAVTSGAILHLTVRDKTKVLPEYLSLVLNSEAVKQQAERDAGGSIILHWRISEIENVVIPIVEYRVQRQISAQIQKSFSLRAESERLLEEAKRMVEREIVGAEA